MSRHLGSFLFVAVLLATPTAFGAEDELPSGTEAPRIVPIAIADTYFAYHDTPPPNREATMMTTASRHGEFALNLAALGFRLEHAKILGTVVLQAGSSVDALYPPSLGGADRVSGPTSNPEVWKHVQVASAGYRFGDLTLEAGIFPSHIGYESFVSTNNWNYTRAMVSDNTPYYLGGVKGTYRVLPNLAVTLLAYNGWAAAYGDNNKYKSFGGKVEWKPLDWLAISDAVSVGPETGGQQREWRIFDDLIVQAKLHARLQLALELWGGTDRAAEGETQKALYYGGALFAKWNFGETTYVAGRAEVVSDADAVLFQHQSLAAAKAIGLNKAYAGTLTVGWQPHPNFIARVEAMYRAADQEFFSVGAKDEKNSTTFVANVAFSY